MPRLIDKNCEQCGILMKSVTVLKKKCDRCIQENKQKNIDKNNQKQAERNYEKAYNRAKEYIEKYTTEDGKTLTPDGFNEVSPITHRSIVQSLRGNTWVDILTMFGKRENLKQYIKDEFEKYILVKPNVSFTAFLCDHLYLSETLILGFDVGEVHKYLGIVYNKHTEDDCKDNFLNIKSQFGYIPLYTDFVKNSKIAMATYAKKFGLNNKQYETIIKMYSTTEEYDDYLKRNKEYRSRLGKETANMNKTLVTKEELELELRRVFDEFYVEYQKYPNVRMFEKILKCDIRTYERKFDMEWEDICEMFGYPIADKASAEYLALQKVKHILNADYEPQKTWDWLRNDVNFPLWVDGYFPQYNLAVEFDGQQHFQPVKKYGGQKTFERYKINDGYKNKLLPKHGIDLIRISAFEDWFNEDFLKEKFIKYINQSVA